MSLNIPESQQRLRTLMDVAMSPKNVRDSDYFELKRDNEFLRAALLELIGMVQDGDFGPQFGTGSPEGVVEANYSLLYVDTGASVLYFNDSYGSDTGWTAL